MYEVRIRNWWRNNPNWPDGLEPNSGDTGRHYAYADTEEEARKICKEYNDSHEPGRLSRKAEFSSRW